jgi:hypothetical protein
MAPANNAISIVIDIDSDDAVRKLKQVDAAIDDVTGTTKMASAATSDFEKQVRALIDKDVALITAKQQLATVTTATTSTMATLRAGLNGVAAAAGITWVALGPISAVILVIATAMAAFDFTRWLVGFTGLDKAIANTTARLIGWGNVAAQETGAKQDVINLAVKRGANAMITYASALEFNAKWFVEWQHKAKEMDDVAARIHAPQELADQMAKWNSEIDKVRSAGSLPALIAGINSHVISVKELSASYRISEGAINLFKQRLVDEAKAHTTAKNEATKHAAELKKLATEHQHFVDSVKNLTSPSVGAVKGFGAYGQLITDISERSGKFREGLFDLDASMNTFHHGISIAGDELATVTIPMFAKLPNVVAQATDAIDAARDAVVSLGDTVRGNLRDALAHIPNLLMQAFTGGGGLMGAVKALGVQISDAIITPLLAKLSAAQRMVVGAAGAGVAGLSNAAGLGTTASTIVGLGTSLAGAAIAAHAATVGMAGFAAGSMGASMAAGALTMGIGTAAIGVALLIKHWWNHRKEVQANTKAINEFTDSMFSVATQAQVNESGNQRWALTVIQVRDAYLATGRSAGQAEADVKALWDSAQHGAAATKAAMDKINAVFAEMKQNTEALDGLLRAGRDIGLTLPPALQDSINHVIDLGIASGDTAGLLKSLTGGAETDFKKMQETAQKYGIDLASLGPQFQSAKLHDSAKNIINDFELLTRNGADVGGVLFGMKDEIGHLVSESLKFGVDIPANMRPWIENLRDTHQLIGDNGDEITDLSGIKFADPIVTEFDKIVAKLQELIDKITGPTGLVAGIGAIPTSRTIDIVEHHRRVDDAANYGARGGLVTAGGIQHLAGGGRILPFPGQPRGTDNIPIWASEGERLLSVRQNRAYEANGGGGDPKVLAELKAMRADMARRDAAAATRDVTAGRRFARAMRDETQKVARR